MAELSHADAQTEGVSNHTEDLRQPESNPDKSLSSFPAHTAVEDANADQDEEAYATKAVKVTVKQMSGYLCHVEATVHIKLNPKLLWEQCIVHPDNAAIYRHMDKCTYRRLVSSTEGGLRRFEVAHEASWRFLVFSGKFTTFLDVNEDAGSYKMEFVMVPEKCSSSVLGEFSGIWKIEPDPTNPNWSISTLSQDIQLKLWAPPPLDKILKNISCRQVRRICEDLIEEAGRINKGKPTLCPYDTVKDKEIGVVVD